MNEIDESPLLRSARELKAYFESKRSTLTPERAASTEDALMALIDSVKAMEAERENLERLNLASQSVDLPLNVIPFRRPPSGFAEVKDRRWILKLDCLIESPHISEIHKMATELHSHSRRYAFLEYRDLDKETRKSLPALLKLGALTLFVPSILDLTLAEQAVLLQLVEQASEQRPLLMVGSTQNFSDLRGEPGVNLEFVSLLSRAYIKLTRPFSEYREQGLIHYFLDSLSESPT